MGARFDGSIWTRYVARTRDGAVGEWRMITSYNRGSIRANIRTHSKFTTSKNTRRMVSLPKTFTNIRGKSANKCIAGRFTLECYLGRTLESWEVCRHGIAGSTDHSYLNVSPGDAVNNMIDDLENGKSETNLTYLIQAQSRLARLISNYTISA